MPMQFLTTLKPKDGEHKFIRNFGGGRAFWGPFRFHLSPNPMVEGIAVDAAADESSRNFWAVERFLPEITAGVQEGWRDIAKRDQRYCCIRLTIRDQSFHPTDTHSEGMRKEGWSFIFGTLERYAEPVPPFRAEWLTSDVVALARGIHAKQALGGLPALTDALLEAGCDDPLAIEHLTTCPDHGPMCWVVEMICAQAAARDGTSD